MAAAGAVRTTTPIESVEIFTCTAPTDAPEADGTPA
jgi:hypothetical protein